MPWESRIASRLERDFDLGGEWLVQGKGGEADEGDRVGVGHSGSGCLVRVWLRRSHDHAGDLSAHRLYVARWHMADPRVLQPPRAWHPQRGRDLWDSRRLPGGHRAYRQPPGDAQPGN